MAPVTTYQQKAMASVGRAHQREAMAPAESGQKVTMTDLAEILKVFQTAMAGCMSQMATACAEAVRNEISQLPAVSPPKFPAMPAGKGGPVNPCFRCGEAHWYRDCPQSQPNLPAAPARKGVPPAACFRCGETQHWYRDCPRSKQPRRTVIPANQPAGRPTAPQRSGNATGPQQ